MNVFVDKEAAVFIPNVFSPNNDLVNDQLLISATSDIIQIERFAIYDRWGNLVFLQSMFPPNDITYAWDGTFNGKPLDPGVFAYMIIYQTGSEQKIHYGDVTIIR